MGVPRRRVREFPCLWMHFCPRRTAGLMWKMITLPRKKLLVTTMITVALLLPVVATICLPVVDVEIATLTVTNLLLAAMLVLNCLFLTELLSSLLLETFPSPLPMMISVTSLPSTGRSKGFGYVTFADRESLVTALEANDVEVCGRPIHVDVAEGRQSEDRRGPSKADSVDKWERGKAVPANERPMRSSRDGAGAPRSERGGRGFGSGRPNRDFEERRERKPLNLKPRSEGAPVGNSAPKKGSNPFGDAKPRDESKFQERQRESERKEE